MIELFSKKGVRVVVEPGSEGHKRAVANGYGPAEAKKPETPPAPQAAPPVDPKPKSKGKASAKPAETE